MNYKHLNQSERYRIHCLMKTQHNITQIAQLLGRDMSTISRELRRNAGCLGYLAKQARELAFKRSESSRYASTLAPWVKEQARELLRLQWNPDHISYFTANSLRRTVCATGWECLALQGDFPHDLLLVNPNSSYVADRSKEGVAHKARSD